MLSFMTNNIKSCFTAGSAILYASYSVLQKHELAVQAASSAMNAVKSAWFWLRDTLSATANTEAEHENSMANYSLNWTGVAAITLAALVASPIIYQIGSFVRERSRSSQPNISDIDGHRDSVVNTQKVPKLVEGTISQYSIQAPYACGPISALAAQALLETSEFTPEQIDQIVESGKTFYTRTLESITKKLKCDPKDLDMTYLSADLHLTTSDAELSLDVERGGMDLPKGNETRLQEGQERANYQALLEPFMKKAVDENFPMVGILTLTPETYAIKYDPNANHWLLFNSHGNDLAYTEAACLIKFDDLRCLASYLAEKKFAVPEGAANNPDINRCVLYRVFKK